MANATLTLSALPRVSTSRPRRWRPLALTLLLPVAVVGFWRGLHALSVEPTQSPAPEPRSLPARVSALGRLSPAGEVVSVAPPTPAGAIAAPRVDQLLVAVGDAIKAGQVVAILDTQRSRAAAVLEAKAKVEVAKAKLAQVRAGPKPHDVRAQEAVIRRSEADLVSGQEDFDRANRLVALKAIAREEYTSRRSKFEQARATVDQAKAQLEAIKTIRPVDVKASEVDVIQAEASLAVAQEDLRSTEVRSPLSGRVLCIRVRPGERVGDRGILDVGNTNEMQVVAEIYEEDVGKVSFGQTAKVRVPTLRGCDFFGMGLILYSDHDLIPCIYSALSTSGCPRIAG